MMDYVQLIKEIKKDPIFKESAVIANGGSYGGMLAAWIRMEYPHVIAGAYAASAPILYFPGTVSPYAFNEIVTKDFALGRADCDNKIRKGF